MGYRIVKEMGFNSWFREVTLTKNIKNTIFVLVGVYAVLWGHAFLASDNLDLLGHYNLLIATSVLYISVVLARILLHKNLGLLPYREEVFILSCILAAGMFFINYISYEFDKSTPVISLLYIAPGVVGSMLFSGMYFFFMGYLVMGKDYIEGGFS